MSLRPLAEADLTMILPWRNTPIVRRAMYTHHEISLEEHYSWFGKLKSDPSAYWFLYGDINGQPRGVIYLTQVDRRQGTAFWGFYASPDAPLGTGMHMSIEAVDLAFYDMGLRKLNAEILANNHRSLRMHRNVGFVEEGLFREQHFDGESYVDVYRLGMLASEWTMCRVRLLGRIHEFGSNSPTKVC
ncbi:MAG: UDP-4-amino-4,6-dideoxy-N-acetyl-beta-L-altrosamine N-acetyltransferase [Castellaniella sp.]|nr:UDP-4-amino-4,6-dideoxy-N-acetyl-beta-L-altrosamine N-acetyltransferase [Castellaniella sp.]